MMDSYKKPTIKDVAREAGVGIGTVSRVLNDSDLVSTETRERVLAAVQSLGFKPNRHARSLPQKTRIPRIGVLTPFISYHSFVERLRGVQRALNATTAQDGTSYELLLYNVPSADHYHQQFEHILQQRSVDGFLIIYLPVLQQQHEALLVADVPYLCLGDVRGETPWLLAIDNALGGYLATRHLLDLGHRRIAYVGDDYPDDYDFPTSRDRQAGYEQALREAHIEPISNYIRLGLHGRDVARKLALELLALPKPPTAIFAMSDVQALGCITAAREMGLRVPEDVSVIGFDDIEISEYAGLTTIRQHLETSGYMGMKHLLRQVANRQAGQPLDGDLPRLPPLEIIERQTTAVPGTK